MAPASGALQKAEGNDHFRAGRYVKAVGSYSAAIAADRTNATYHLNRSQAYLKLDKYEDAARDATSCLSIDSKNTKALFRRALAYKGLGRYVEALNDLKKARVLDGSNPEIEHEITTVQNLLEEQVKAEQKKKAQRTAVVQRGQAAPTTGEGNGSHEPTQASSKASTSKLQAALAPQPGDANSTASESKDDFLRPVTTRRLDRTSSTSTPTPAAGNANATEESVTAQSVDSRHQASSPVRADIDSSSQSKPLSFAAAKEARAQRLAQSRPRTAQVNSGTSYPSLSSPVALPPPAHQASASEPPAALATSIATAYEFSRAWREAKAGTPESSLKCRLQVLQSLRAQDLPNILGNSLEPELLSDIIHSCHASRDSPSFSQQALQLLSALPSVQRFDFISLLLDENDRRKAQEVLKSDAAVSKSIIQAWA